MLRQNFEGLQSVCQEESFQVEELCPADESSDFRLLEVRGRKTLGSSQVRAQGP